MNAKLSALAQLSAGAGAGRLFRRWGLAQEFVTLPWSVCFWRYSWSSCESLCPAGARRPPPPAAELHAPVACRPESGGGAWMRNDRRARVATWRARAAREAETRRGGTSINADTVLTGFTGRRLWPLAGRTRCTTTHRVRKLHASTGALGQCGLERRAAPRRAHRPPPPTRAASLWGCRWRRGGYSELVARSSSITYFVPKYLLVSFFEK